jgi:hypothetical protein
MGVKTLIMKLGSTLSAAGVNMLQQMLDIALQPSSVDSISVGSKQLTSSLRAILCAGCKTFEA